MHQFKTTVLYWNIYLRFLLEAYLELSIASFLRMNHFRVHTRADAFLTAYACIILVILTASMVGSLVFLRSKHKSIADQDFKDRYGALTLGLQIREKSAMMQPFMFMLRRFIYAVAFVYLPRFNYFQIQIVVFKTSMLMAF